ncbi:hypothetical protein MishRS11D_34410 [Methylomagnum ishizawai]|nr:hypothetical protein MishRS11D_34410 [Methylomagnum ishizawai]
MPRPPARFPGNPDKDTAAGRPSKGGKPAPPMVNPALRGRLPFPPRRAAPVGTNPPCLYTIGRIHAAGAWDIPANPLNLKQNPRYIDT